MFQTTILEGSFFILVKLINYSTLYHPVRGNSMRGSQPIRTFFVRRVLEFTLFRKWLLLYQCAHWTYRPYPPTVKNEKYPPILTKNSKLPPNILTISDNILIYGKVYNSYVLLLKLIFKVKYNLVLSSFYHTFWSQENHQLVGHKIPPEADKILPFYSDLGRK